VSSESCAADKCKEQRKKEHKQLYRFLPQTGSSHVPLALPRRVPLKCNVGLQVAQSHKKETYLLKDNSKRLPLLNHNWKRLNLTITKNWIRFWILDIQSEVFTIQYEQNRLCFTRHLRILRYKQFEEFSKLLMFVYDVLAQSIGLCLILFYMCVSFSKSSSIYIEVLRDVENLAVTSTVLLEALILHPWSFSWFDSCPMKN